MITLTIDTTTQTMIVGLFQADEQVATITKSSKNDHASILMPAIEEILEQNAIEPNMLTKIIVNNGPGSYTGTRIGVTTAKTLGWALNIPVQTASALQVLHKQTEKKYTTPIIDARRNAIYTTLYKTNNNTTSQIEPEQHVSVDTWKETLLPLKKELIIFCSDQEQLCTIFPKEEGWTVEEIQMNAQSLYDAAYSNCNGELEHVHHVTPNYLRITEAEQNLLNRQKEAKNND